MMTGRSWFDPVDGATETISTAEYGRLVRADAKLEALQDAGVENWEGYEYAMELFGRNDD